MIIVTNTDHPEKLCIYLYRFTRVIIISIDYYSKCLFILIATHTHTHPQRNISQPQKELNNGIFSNMDEPRDYQLNEASQRQIYDITYVESKI